MQKKIVLVEINTQLMKKNIPDNLECVQLIKDFRNEECLTNNRRQIKVTAKGMLLLPK